MDRAQVQCLTKLLLYNRLPMRFLGVGRLLVGCVVGHAHKRQGLLWTEAVAVCTASFLAKQDQVCAGIQNGAPTKNIPVFLGDRKSVV